MLLFRSLSISQGFSDFFNDSDLDLCSKKNPDNSPSNACWIRAWPSCFACSNANIRKHPEQGDRAVSDHRIRTEVSPRSIFWLKHMTGRIGVITFTPSELELEESSLGACGWKYKWPRWSFSSDKPLIRNRKLSLVTSQKFRVLENISRNLQRHARSNISASLILEMLRCVPKFLLVICGTDFFFCFFRCFSFLTTSLPAGSSSKKTNGFSHFHSPLSPSQVWCDTPIFTSVLASF